MQWVITKELVYTLNWESGYNKITEIANSKHSELHRKSEEEKNHGE